MEYNFKNIMTNKIYYYWEQIFLVRNIKRVLDITKAKQARPTSRRRRFIPESLIVPPANRQRHMRNLEDIMADLHKSE